MDADILIYLGSFGFIVGILLLFFFFIRRLSRTGKRLSGKKVKSPGILASIRNLLLVLLWIFLSIMIFFIGFFLQAYYSFTFEKPVAEVHIHSTDNSQMIVIELTEYAAGDDYRNRQFLLKGEQWVLEGDILKWNDWLNFMGLETRYRLTRIRGRYLNTQDERSRPASIYSLVPDETHAFWRYMYRYGAKMPFVSTVYGDAVFQDNAIGKRFLILVTNSGFISREKTGYNK
jgi:hypothetical protein